MKISEDFPSVQTFLHCVATYLSLLLCSLLVLTGCVTTMRGAFFPLFSHYAAPASSITRFPIIPGFPLTFQQRTRPL